MPESHPVIPIHESMLPRIEAFLNEHWGAPLMVSRGTLYDLRVFPGFVVLGPDGGIAGLIQYRFEGVECEVMVLSSKAEGQGIGGALIEGVRRLAMERGCKRLFLITTNDNINALRFYQKRGFTLAALYPNALEHSRRLKPGIPLVGAHGIPLRDEIELEMWLG